MSKLLALIGLDKRSARVAHAETEERLYLQSGVDDISNANAGARRTRPRRVSAISSLNMTEACCPSLPLGGRKTPKSGTMFGRCSSPHIPLQIPMVDNSATLILGYDVGLDPGRCRGAFFWGGGGLSFLYNFQVALNTSPNAPLPRRRSRRNTTWVSIQSAARGKRARNMAKTIEDCGFGEERTIYDRQCM